MSAVRFGKAIEAYVGDLARRGRRPSTLRSYSRLLNDFADVANDRDVEELTLEHYERFLNRWVGAAPSTLASGVSLAHGFSRFLHERGWADTDVAAGLKRPKRPAAEDLDVVTVSSEDVARLLEACEDWQELLCLATAAYMGARRNALALVRLADVDFAAGRVRFLEKGGKVVTKPMADEYLAILRAAQAYGVWTGPQDYLIPNRRPASVRRRERSDKVIWETVKRVARRAGITTHVHALRAAFAVQFDAAHPGEVLALKALLGHKRIETTEVYLRRKDKAQAMEAVRDLSFGSSVFAPQALEAHTGFEPVPSVNPVPEPLRRKLAELTTKARERA